MKADVPSNCMWKKLQKLQNIMQTYQLYSLWKRSVFPVLLRKSLYYFSQTFCWACWKIKFNYLKANWWNLNHHKYENIFRIYSILGNVSPQEAEQGPQVCLATHIINTILIFSSNNIRSHYMKWRCKLHLVYAHHACFQSDRWLPVILVSLYKQ